MSRLKKTEDLSISDEINKVPITKWSKRTIIVALIVLIGTGLLLIVPVLYVVLVIVGFGVVGLRKKEEKDFKYKSNSALFWAILPEALTFPIGIVYESVMFIIGLPFRSPDKKGIWNLWGLL